MRVEFAGGPIDGQMYDVPDETELWVVTQPDGAITDFRVDDRAEVSRVPLHEFSYAVTKTFAKASGARLFSYTGERVIK